jgi:hypothetical protein
MATDLVQVESDAQALEADPVGYMAVVLHRAKGWLAEATSIDAVRDTKAIAVGYESVIREKELAFDAQLSATEIVRRCERRIGELVREGQTRGEIRRQGDRPAARNQHMADAVLHRDGEQQSPVAIFANHAEGTDSYAMADAPGEQFETAIDEAKAEGNLSRANVVRKVKGEEPKPAERSEWQRGRKHIDSNRVLSSLATELDAATTGLELMEPEQIDPDLLHECLPLIKQSIQTIQRHLRRIQND